MKQKSASLLLVIFMAFIALWISVGLFRSDDMKYAMIVYWMLAAIKHVLDISEHLRRKKYSEPDDPYYLREYGQNYWVGPFFSYEAAVKYVEKFGDEKNFKIFGDIKNVNYLIENGVDGYYGE